VVRVRNDIFVAVELSRRSRKSEINGVVVSSGMDEGLLCSRRFEARCEVSSSSSSDATNRCLGATQSAGLWAADGRCRQDRQHTNADDEMLLRNPKLAAKQVLGPCPGQAQLRPTSARQWSHLKSGVFGGSMVVDFDALAV
jgi:hypothetical protein